MLGIFGYHQAFIPGYANIIQPLNNLLEKNIPFIWTDEHTAAIDKLVEVVSNGPVLWQPDYVQLFFLEVDASQYAIGAILTQKDKRG